MIYTRPLSIDSLVNIELSQRRNDFNKFFFYVHC